MHGITAYLPTDLDSRRDLPLVMGDIFGALAASPALRHVWVQFDRFALALAGSGRTIVARSSAACLVFPSALRGLLCSCMASLAQAGSENIRKDARQAGIRTLRNACRWLTVI